MIYVHVTAIFLSYYFVMVVCKSENHVEQTISSRATIRNILVYFKALYCNIYNDSLLGIIHISEGALNTKEMGTF